MSSLIDKIKAARLTSITVDKFSFTVRRPTDLEAIRLTGKSQEQILKEFVTDWKGVQEIDLVPGGTSIDVPFDSDLFSEWIADQPQLWDPIISCVVEAYKRHNEQRDSTEKKSGNG